MNKYIIDYIKTLSNNEQVQKLLIKTIGKILLRQVNNESFIIANDEKIIHIRDWIFSVVENNDPWKEPRVLTIDALNNSADKYFEKQINKLTKIELDEVHEKLVADLDDYYIVQMLTPEALDNESKQMQHCIGHGSYDRNLNKEEYQYLSLRDKFNKAHVTLEIENNKILQLQGKQNKQPEDKYLEKLIPWLANNNYSNIPWLKLGYFYDKNTKIYEKNIDLKLEENIDFEILYGDSRYDIYNLKTEKSICYYYAKNNNFNDYKITVDNLEQDKIFSIFDKENNTYNILSKRKKISLRNEKKEEYFISETNEQNNRILIKYLYNNNYMDKQIFTNYALYGLIKDHDDKLVFVDDFDLKENIDYKIERNGSIDILDVISQEGKMAFLYKYKKDKNEMKSLLSIKNQNNSEMNYKLFIDNKKDLSICSVCYFDFNYNGNKDYFINFNSNYKENNSKDYSKNSKFVLDYLNNHQKFKNEDSISYYYETVFKNENNNIIMPDILTLNDISKPIQIGESFKIFELNNVDDYLYFINKNKTCSNISQIGIKHLFFEFMETEYSTNISRTKYVISFDKYDIFVHQNKYLFTVLDSEFKFNMQDIKKCKMILQDVLKENKIQIQNENVIALQNSAYYGGEFLYFIYYKNNIIEYNDFLENHLKYVKSEKIYNEKDKNISLYKCKSFMSSVKNYFGLKSLGINNISSLWQSYNYYSKKNECFYYIKKKGIKLNLFVDETTNTVQEILIDKFNSKNVKDYIEILQTLKQHGYKIKSGFYKNVKLFIDENQNIFNENVNSLKGSIFCSMKLDGIKKMPEDLIVKGDLDLTCSSVSKFSKGLQVEGDIFISEYQIKDIEEKININGYIKYVMEICDYDEDSRYSYKDIALKLDDFKNEILSNKDYEYNG